MVDHKVKPPPPGWGKDGITSFFETAKENSYATFHNCQRAFKRLIEIDDLFASAFDCMENSSEYFSLLFFLKTRSAFLAALRLATATQIPEAYMVLRGTLENSLYGWFMYKRKDLCEAWLKRHESDEHKQEVKKKFQIRTMLDLLEKDNAEEGRIANVLYERCIDFGAHPNEMSLSSSLKITETEKEVKFDVHYLTEDPTTIMLCLKTSAQVGASCLKILGLIIPERFKIAQLDRKLEWALRGL